MITLPPASFELRALVLAKLLDGGTTAVGLLFVPTIVEANPFLRALIGLVGVVPGLVLGTAVVLVVVVAVTELGVSVCARRAPDDAWMRPAVRLVGYLPLSLIFAAASLHNLQLVTRALVG